MGRVGLSKIEKEQLKKKKAEEKEAKKKEKNYEGKTIYATKSDWVIIESLARLANMDKSSLLTLCLKVAYENSLLKEVAKNTGILYEGISNKIKPGINKRPSFLSELKKKNTSEKDLATISGNYVVLSKLISFLLSSDSRDKNLFYRYKSAGHGEVLTRVSDVNFYLDGKLIPKDSKNSKDTIGRLLGTDLKRINVVLILDDFSLTKDGPIIKNTGILTLNGLRLNLSDKFGIPFTSDGFTNVLKNIKDSTRSLDYFFERGSNDVHCFSAFNPLKSKDNKAQLYRYLENSGNKDLLEVYLKFCKTIY